MNKEVCKKCLKNMAERVRKTKVLKIELDDDLWEAGLSHVLCAFMWDLSEIKDGQAVYDFKKHGIPKGCSYNVEHIVLDNQDNV